MLKNPKTLIYIFIINLKFLYKSMGKTLKFNPLIIRIRKYLLNFIKREKHVKKPQNSYIYFYN